MGKHTYRAELIHSAILLLRDSQVQSMVVGSGGEANTAFNPITNEEINARYPHKVSTIRSSQHHRGSGEGVSPWPGAIRRGFLTKVSWALDRNCD